MASDILEQVREEILKEDEQLLPWVPKNLDKTWETQAGMAGAIAGIIAGATFGAHMGLAGAWGAIVGTVPCAIVGGVIGYFSGAKVGSKIQRDPLLKSRASTSSPAILSASHQQQQLSGSGTCPACGAPKSTWWDSRKNACSKCGLKL